jgi:hypothetical protein
MSGRASLAAAAALLASVALPVEQPAASAATRNWVTVPDTHDLWCVDRDSIKYDGSWVSFEDQMCGIDAFPIEPEKVDCSQDMSVRFASYVYRKGEWKLRPHDADSSGGILDRYVCAGR